MFFVDLEPAKININVLEIHITLLHNKIKVKDLHKRKDIV